MKFPRFALLISLATAAIRYPSIAFAPGDQKTIIDNERLAVRDTVWAAGDSRPLGGHQYDFVDIYLVGGTFKVTLPDGTSHTEKRKPDDAVFRKRGTMETTDVASKGGPSRAIVIDIKDYRIPPLHNTSGYPNAFPRAGVKKLFENDRVNVWDYTWILAMPTPMHLHDKDSVVVYLDDGALASITPDGRRVISENAFGLTKFVARERLHSEELVRGNARAIIVELK